VRLANVNSELPLRSTTYLRTSNSNWVWRFASGILNSSSAMPGHPTVIDLYTWKTANCQKVNIAVAELGLPVEVHAVDISTGAQKAAEYLALNPNGKVPLIVDRERKTTLFESGAILLYLADITGKLMPAERSQRWTAVQWVFWQMAGLGPNAAQVFHFRSDPSRGDYALRRFEDELARLVGVLETVLSKSEYLAEEYSMADIAVWPWVTRYERLGIPLEDHPVMLRWYREIAARPAVQEGFALLNSGSRIPTPR
jgi:GST-like protein